MRPTFGRYSYTRQLRRWWDSLTPWRRANCAVYLLCAGLLLAAGTETLLGSEGQDTGLLAVGPPPDRSNVALPPRTSPSLPPETTAGPPVEPATAPPDPSAALPSTGGAPPTRLTGRTLVVAQPPPEPQIITVIETVPRFPVEEVQDTTPTLPPPPRATSTTKKPKPTTTSPPTTVRSTTTTRWTLPPILPPIGL